MKVRKQWQCSLIQSTDLCIVMKRTLKSQSWIFISCILGRIKLNNATLDALCMNVWDYGILDFSDIF